ncbi:MAG: hypothetical protein GFGODING_02747 [Flavobacteriales bacterium]|nr:hypothetical protein [Flavobacteriales bacterium]
MEQPEPTAYTPEQRARMERLGLEPGDCTFTPEGYLVYSARYHLKRGYCCGNRCRHCPYGHEAVRKVQG